ncbi:membrane-anchored ubiquitin-fold protein 6 precursor [Prunus dulcis]|uniref:Membrane-anchored ubiquitin-fold protein 6 n=1 Tax=Prunus dulcis TaxID=3755 RepID=A0A4Y1QV82_PRUDU|nr:membrane-anchored ubiquitin-fold protein 6 precursor [Prunus dulcis]
MTVMTTIICQKPKISSSMAAGQDLIELKFRLSDGTDIGPHKYSPSATVQSLKEKILAQWPKEKENGPRTINDLKLINAGKILENNRTLADSRLPVGELPGGLITMHVVVRPPIADKKNEEYVYIITIYFLGLHIIASAQFHQRPFKP